MHYCLCFYHVDGQVMVVSSSDDTKQPIQFNRVKVTLSGYGRHKVAIAVNASQALFLPNSASGTLH